MYKANPNINRTTASEILEVSRRTIQNWVKKLEKE
jgi:transcriptional antiterminator